MLIKTFAKTKNGQKMWKGRHNLRNEVHKVWKSAQKMEKYYHDKICPDIKGGCAISRMKYFLEGCVPLRNKAFQGNRKQLGVGL